MRFYLRVLAFGKGKFGLLALAVGFLVVFSLFSAASLSLFIPFLEILFAEPGSVDVVGPESINGLGDVKDAGYAWLYRQMAVAGKQQVLIYFCFIAFGAIVVKNIAKYLSGYFMAEMELSIVQRLRNYLFEQLSRLPLSFYTQKRRGHVMNVATTDVQNVQEAVVGTLMPLVSDPITMAVFLSFMLLLSWKLTLFTLIILPITALGISRVSKSLRRRAKRGQSAMDNLLSVLDEFVGGIRIVKAFTAELFTRRKFEVQNAEYTRQMLRFKRRHELVSPLTEIMSVIVILAIIYFSSTLILSGEDSLKGSEFIGFIVLFGQVLTPMKAFSGAVTRIQKARISFERIEALTEQPITPTERTDGQDITGFERALQLQQVHFGYEEGRPVLQDINLTVERGQTVALVGPSGGGKSTLLDLVCRFYDPTKGSIVLDGVPLTDINAASLRKQMGIVTQEGILFNDSVLANIAYGVSGAIDEAAAKRAAEIANADGFISQLPQGYHTVIGERGLMLSGGQRQRLSIARAVYKNPPILILDEATSALDSESERLVQAALDRLMEGRTVLVVAHRLSTILDADKIVVIDGGRIAEEGTHAALLRQQGLYYSLYQKQFADSAAADALPPSTL